MLDRVPVFVLASEVCFGVYIEMVLNSLVSSEKNHFKGHWLFLEVTFNLGDDVPSVISHVKSQGIICWCPSRWKLLEPCVI